MSDNRDKAMEAIHTIVRTIKPGKPANARTGEAAVPPETEEIAPETVFKCSEKERDDFLEKGAAKDHKEKKADPEAAKAAKKRAEDSKKAGEKRDAAQKSAPRTGTGTQTAKAKKAAAKKAAAPKAAPGTGTGKKTSKAAGGDGGSEDAKTASDLV